MEAAGPRPGAVLFACSLNSVRSPMAAAIARDLFPGKVYVASAGVRRGAADPFAVAVMEEIGLDIRQHRPHTFEDLEDMNFDLVITLAPEAHHRALELTRYYAVDVEYWPTGDPSATAGSREQIMAAYRNVRDGLRKRILARLGPLEATA
ncbi:low molecular weight phosphatase family protein [Methylobrevis pamukkalensis]|uniref:Arsenate-mycothiol transferase ArsC2 n=1 Tax=Methylobrevis pamukkalensis TaxID=1439726 RepID=A0A1E3GZU9_9HYPH|nr:arsenate reductase ArsC [Methylobrevis pamukkalensis]ODN69570.1 Arsenate-mycothiol transferase ArsC2 [Methylobrevis pamukkalensis]